MGVIVLTSSSTLPAVDRRIDTPQIAGQKTRTDVQLESGLAGRTTSGTRVSDPMTEALLSVSAVQGLSCTWWQVKDSNLRSFRDGFTVRSHWPLGQPAWCAWKDSKSAAPG